MAEFVIKIKNPRLIIIVFLFEIEFMIFLKSKQEHHLPKKETFCFKNTITPFRYNEEYLECFMHLVNMSYEYYIVRWVSSN